ncbi:MAG: hypothetical protein R3263_08740, partial [Myxococcota bacterium]|nr:hypothetical protein [Myxococcota bacterium]
MTASPFPRAALLVALLVGALAAPAFAGVRLEAVTRRVDAQEGPQRERTTLRVEGSRLRVDSGDGRGTLLYDAGTAKAWLLDHRDKQYVSVDRSQARALANQARTLQTELRKRLEGRLSPAQLVAAEGLLGDVSRAEAEAVRVRETGGRGEVAGVACREMEVLRGEERVAELCGAAPEAAGLPPEAFAVLRDAAAFAEESVGGLAPGGISESGLDLIRGAGNLDVLPLRVRAFEDGQLVAESEVQQVVQEAMPPDTFALPDG